VNGVFFGLSILLVLAWKIAGYLGVDYFVLPRVADLWVEKESIDHQNAQQTANQPPSVLLTL